MDRYPLPAPVFLFCGKEGVGAYGGSMCSIIARAGWVPEEASSAQPF